jgi:hypothetical protein
MIPLFVSLDGQGGILGARQIALVGYLINVNDKICCIIT